MLYVQGGFEGFRLGDSVREKGGYEMTSEEGAAWQSRSLFCF